MHPERIPTGPLYLQAVMASENVDIAAPSYLFKESEILISSAR